MRLFVARRRRASPRVGRGSVSRENTRVAVNAVAIAPVPLAVAIGVPVAEVTPYYYSYSAYAASTLAAGRRWMWMPWLTKLAEKLAAAKSRFTAKCPAARAAKSAAAGKLAAVADRTKCAECHSGPEPKGKLSLDNPAALDCPTRLKAIRAILSEKMPQGGPRLTPDEAGKLLEELVGE